MFSSCNELKLQLNHFLLLSNMTKFSYIPLCYTHRFGSPGSQGIVRIFIRQINPIGVLTLMILIMHAVESIPQSTSSALNGV